jgi:hypothetical protein
VNGAGAGAGGPPPGGARAEGAALAPIRAPSGASSNPLGGAPAPSAGKAGASSDWVVALGAELAAAADEASADISARIDAALHEVKPLVLSGMRLLPDLARSFASLVQAQVFALLTWLASAWEAAGDAAHAARSEWAEIVVEADFGLEKDAEAAAAARRAASARGGAGSARGGAGGAGGARDAKAKRRATVN